MNIKAVTRGAVIGGLYYVLVLIFQPISFGGSLGMQFRVSEFLTVLPFFFPETILGLTIGCILANLLSPFGLIDIVFGSFCTLLAGSLTYYLSRFKKPNFAYLGIIPPVIVNALGVGFYLSILSNPKHIFSWKIYGLFASSIFLGQAVSVGIGGSLVIMYLLRKGTKIK